MILKINDYTSNAPARAQSIGALRGWSRRRVAALGVLAAVLFLAASIHPARAETPEELIKRVQRRYEMTGDLEAVFTQRATLRTLNETQLSSGKVYIRKPGKMRWDYLKPEPQAILLKDNMLRVYTPELNQLVEQPVANVYKAKTPTAFLAGKAKLTELFSVRVEAINKRRERAPWRLVLTPKEENPQLKELRLEVNEATYDIVRSVLIDHFGNVTDIRYSNVKTNRGLDEELFNLKLPPGVERVRPPFMPLE